MKQVRYFDNDGAPFAVDGVYGVKREYNAYANIERETWLDAEGKPARNSEGYATVRYDYDLSYSEIVERYYRYYLDENGDPTVAKNGAWGIAMLYYPATRVHTVTYIDQNDLPVVIDEGYAVLEYEEDVYGNRIWEGYYDEIHAQTNCADGYSSVERAFDEEGRMISERYLDRYNKLTNNKEGIAGWNGYYDAEGKLVITSRYDKDRKQLPADGAARGEE